MRILITGAGGALGRKLVSSISVKEYAIRLLARERTKDFPEIQADILKGDLLNGPSLAAAVKDVDVVVHLAGLTHTNDETAYYRINTEGTKNLLAAGQAAQVKRFIFISSRAAGLNGGAYARSKLLAEEEVRKSGLNWVILRLAEVFGAGENDAVAKLIKIIRASYFIPIIGDGQYKLCPIFVDDAVAGIIAVLKNPAINKAIYNLAGPEELTYNDLIDRIISEIKLKRKKIFLPIALVKMILELFSLIGVKAFVKDQLPRLLSDKSADISQAVGDFGFQPRSFRVGLRELLNPKGQSLC